MTKSWRQRSKDENAVVVRLLVCETRSKVEWHGDMTGRVYMHGIAV